MCKDTVVQGCLHRDRTGKSQNIKPRKIAGSTKVGLRKILMADCTKAFRDQCIENISLMININMIHM